ncbi:sulfopyruvate decarboxylase subunit beta [Methanocrinis sp.]|uniref:sulfopyruvate decarboxylase subunit beta n=1 Tax=Methanocrinis sp. TaxID=3101522 RepID=UPI003D139027
MKRIEAISIIAREAEAQDALLVGNIGFPSRELCAVGDRPENFYMLGSMGLASSIGLGLALARPDKRVIAIDGDGAVLMNLGSLATIADRAPENYLLVILDNGCYGSTGSQPTCTSRRADLARMAEGAGVSEVDLAATPAEVRVGLAGRGVLVVKVESGNAEVPVIDLSPEEIMERFMARSAPPSPSS